MKILLEGEQIESGVLYNNLTWYRWFARNPGARENIFLATKYANHVDPKTGERSVRNEPDYIRGQCAKSLERLQTNYIDLYYLHRADKKQPIEIAVKVMKELQDAGKIKYIGLSEVSAETIRRASKIAHIDAVQMEVVSHVSAVCELEVIDLWFRGSSVGEVRIARSRRLCSNSTEQ